MAGVVAKYLSELCEGFGNGWNRFWFTPTNPLTLGVLRVAVGSMALYVVATYGFDLDRWFGPGGMLPQNVIEESASFDLVSGRPVSDFRPSYLFLAHSSAELWTCHVASLIVLALFTLGLWTRTTSALALVVVLSYIHRAPMLTAELEPILTLIMAYVCLGSLFFGSGPAPMSLDCWRARRRETAAAAQLYDSLADRSLAATIAVRLIQVHLSVVYLMMGLAKLAEPSTAEEPGVWWLGDGIWWLIAKPDGPLVDFTALHDNIYVLNAWTHSIVLFEIAFGILIWNRLARPLLLALSVPMWISLALVTGLVPFCLMMLIANLAFIAPQNLSKYYIVKWPF